MEGKKLKVYPMTAIKISDATEEIYIKPNKEILLEIHKNKVNIFTEGNFEGTIDLKSKLSVQGDGCKTLIKNNDEPKLVDYRYPPTSENIFDIEIIKEDDGLKIVNLGSNCIDSFIK